MAPYTLWIMLDGYDWQTAELAETKCGLDLKKEIKRELASKVLSGEYLEYFESLRLKLVKKIISKESYNSDVDELCKYVDISLKAVLKLCPYDKKTFLDKLEKTEPIESFTLLNALRALNVIGMDRVDTSDEDAIRKMFAENTLVFAYLPHSQSVNKRCRENSTGTENLSTCKKANITLSAKPYLDQPLLKNTEIPLQSGFDDYLINLIKPYQELFRKIKEEAPKDPETYSDPNTTLDIPFPFLGETCLVDRPIEDGKFGYTGSEQFIEVLNKIKELEIPYGHRKLFISMNVGCYDLSSIPSTLTAITCFLFQQGERVVYLPDCRAMTEDFLAYIKYGLLLAFGDSSSHQLEIQQCHSVDAIHSFCEGIVLKNNIRLYFIFEVINALDHDIVKDEDDIRGRWGCGYNIDNKDHISNSKKDQIRTDIDRITFKHYRITASLKNNSGSGSCMDLILLL